MPEQPHNHREEYYYKKSKQKGYRARSAYKLLDIHKRFNIFKRAFYILDLGSAPGSWLQVTREFAEKNLKKYNDQYYHRDHFKIMGVDVKKISPVDDITTVKMDIYNPEIQNIIDEFFGDKLDLIISDASINKSGNKFSDQIRQTRLCYKILDITKTSLKKKNFLALPLSP